MSARLIAGDEGRWRVCGFCRASIHMDEGYFMPDRFTSTADSIICEKCVLRHASHCPDREANDDGTL